MRFTGMLMASASFAQSIAAQRGTVKDDRAGWPDVAVVAIDTLAVDARP